jgi:hypothetical protein
LIPDVIQLDAVELGILGGQFMDGGQLEGAIRRMGGAEPVEGLSGVGNLEPVLPPVRGDKGFRSAIE